MTITFVRWLAFSKNSPRLRQTSWCWPQISLNAATLVRYQSSSQAGLWIYTSWLNAIYSSTPRDPGWMTIWYSTMTHIPWDLGRDPFNQNSNRSDREKRTTSKGGPVFRLDWTDPLSLVEWIAPLGLLQLDLTLSENLDRQSSWKKF